MLRQEAVDPVSNSTPTVVRLHILKVEHNVASCSVWLFSKTEASIERYGGVKSRKVSTNQPLFPSILMPRISKSRASAWRVVCGDEGNRLASSTVLALTLAPR